MKSLGITRPVDLLGRIVLPIELRRNLNIKEGNYLEIFTHNDQIILRPYRPGCVICKRVRDEEEMIEGVCRECVVSLADKLKERAKDG